MSSIEIRGHIDNSLLTNSTPYRMIVYVSKDPSTTMTLTNIYSATDSDKFWVLHDRIHDVTSFSWFPPTNLFLKRRLNVEYSVDIGNEPVKHHVRLLIMTEANVDWRGHVKLWYKDV